MTDKAATGQIFTATVKDMASDGRGVVVHPSGRTMFAAGVWVGECGEFRVTEVRGRIGFADLVELTTPVPARIAPPCRYQGSGPDSCGGCPWQFVTYAAQLEAKQQRVVAEMRRLGVADAVQAIWPSAKVFGYRNRAQLKTDGRVLGFVANRTNALVPVSHCMVLDEANNLALARLQQQMPNDEWVPARRTPWTTLDINAGQGADQIGVNQRLPFMQANAGQNSRIREWLGAHLARIDPGATVIELFCGSGNFTEIIAAAPVEAIIAVDSAAEAIAALDRKQLSRVEARVANLFDDAALARIFAELHAARTLVLDPPREGLKSTSGLFAKPVRLKDVLYISCDLATLCRDVRSFMAHRYRVVEVQPVDMVPHTPHIECLVHLAKT